MRILIAGKREVLRSVLKTLLQTRLEYEIVAMAANKEELFMMYEATRPDLLLLDEDLMEQETVYLEALAAETFELTLYDFSGNTVALFSVVSQELAATSWQVVSYNNGTGGVVSVANETQITTNFAEDGQPDGNAGCSDYFGLFETEDNNIAACGGSFMPEQPKEDSLLACVKK